MLFWGLVLAGRAFAQLTNQQGTLQTPSLSQHWGRNPLEGARVSVFHVSGGHAFV